MGEWSFVFRRFGFNFLFFIVKRKLRYDFVLWPITIGGLGTAFVLKEIFHRSRPIGGLVAETSSSFPSRA